MSNLSIASTSTESIGGGVAGGDSSLYSTSAPVTHSSIVFHPTPSTVTIVPQQQQQPGSSPIQSRSTSTSNASSHPVSQTTPMIPITLPNLALQTNFTADMSHDVEMEFALQNKKTMKRVLKISKHWTDAMKAYCQNCHLFSEELLKQSDQMVEFAQPREKNIGENLVYFGNTLRAVNSVHDQMLNEIQDVFSTPLANFVDYDFAEVVESHKKMGKLKEEYEGTLGKISTAIKKSKQGIDESKLSGYEQELEKQREVLQQQNQDLEAKLNDLSFKNETKYLRSLLLFVNSQYLFFNRGAKLFSNLKPRIEELERHLEEISPPKVVEGHLLKKSKQVMGGWNKCWYVLKDGMLYCYKGKKEFHPENALNILLCSVRLPQQLQQLPTTAPPTQQGSSKQEKQEQQDYRFEILHPRKKQPIVLQAESDEERDRWVAAIQEAISNSLNSQSLSGGALGGGRPSIAGSSSTGRLSATGMPTSGDEVNQQVMRIILKANGNNVCADCSSVDPDWASINLGVIICKVCSGVHRSLGTHISKVRSLTLDKWSPESIHYMREVGNNKFNILYEHQLSGQTKPTDKSDRMTKEAYIRAKYKTKEFLIKSALTQEELNKTFYELTSSDSGIRDATRYLKLIGQGADINHVDQYGRAALHQVIWKADDVIIPELLLQNGAYITSTDSRGWSPMHYAAFFNRPRCASLLMKRGYETIKSKCVDNLGRTPLDLAIMNKSKEVEQILRGEELELGLTFDTIEAGDVQKYEATAPLSSEFPSGSSPTQPPRYEYNEYDEEKYLVDNEIDLNWSESERDSVGRASFSGAEGNPDLPHQLNSSFNSNTSSSGMTTTTTTKLDAAQKNDSANNPATGDNNSDPKLNRPKSKRRPSLLGRGRNTLRLMKNKLGAGKNTDAAFNEQLEQQLQTNDNTSDDEVDDDNELSSPPADTMSVVDTVHNNTKEQPAEQPTSAAEQSTSTKDAVAANVVSANQLNNDEKASKPPTTSPSTSLSKKIFNKFKGIGGGRKSKEDAGEHANDISDTASTTSVDSKSDNVVIKKK
ncbi:hypothetical protein SAMD00019534_098830 [Acytostelium subglobosum LB1]|uniref:hypothetical protein n=1 Tax=Acytostelium subglobosum LB1 TaxID=1410327 RepID=UPI000644EB9C|nr:hypothetical protein SAMD00019534_098830 [Acytostelium subglobosum LB1]GAM26708.1 hypothetical protein SAMD00019534_098830 [Acytostelium subglobosum LB1]|eukprot:XP_012750369.1 hypothetical protein SAMD00019534_098830 [Acytostelium subglobosum LB1]